MKVREEYMELHEETALDVTCFSYLCMYPPVFKKEK